jgi:hypothetical protein
MDKKKQEEMDADISTCVSNQPAMASAHQGIPVVKKRITTTIRFFQACRLMVFG